MEKKKMKVGTRVSVFVDGSSKFVNFEQCYLAGVITECYLGISYDVKLDGFGVNDEAMMFGADRVFPEIKIPKGKPKFKKGDKVVVTEEKIVGLWKATVIADSPAITVVRWKGDYADHGKIQRIDRTKRYIALAPQNKIGKVTRKKLRKGTKKQIFF